MLAVSALWLGACNFVDTPDTHLSNLSFDFHRLHEDEFVHI